MSLVPPLKAHLKVFKGIQVKRLSKLNLLNKRFRYFLAHLGKIVVKTYYQTRFAIHIWFGFSLLNRETAVLIVLASADVCVYSSNGFKACETPDLIETNVHDLNLVNSLLRGRSHGNTPKYSNEGEIFLSPDISGHLRTSLGISWHLRVSPGISKWWLIPDSLRGGVSSLNAVNRR